MNDLISRLRGDVDHIKNGRRENRHSEFRIVVDPEKGPTFRGLDAVAADIEELLSITLPKLDDGK